MTSKGVRSGWGGGHLRNLTPSNTATKKRRAGGAVGDTETGLCGLGGLGFYYRADQTVQSVAIAATFLGVAVLPGVKARR